MSGTIGDALPLPCGAVLPNRIGKAAMTEGLANGFNQSTPELERLYRVWSEGGAGLLLTGNVQVDRSHLERPGNLVIDDNGGLDALRRLAGAGTRNGNHLWMQINHPGRQTDRRINPAPMAPSAVPLQVEGDYGAPRPMLESEILDVIRRFARVASVAQETGFTGVEVHSAHGYLLSQFLSPRVNRRDDDWGGPLENRARLLLEVVRAIRNAVGPEFPIGVKLNSADFQQGGFTMDESAQVARWLSEERIDLLELSGGNYERKSMGGEDTAESTLRREAHFLDFAHQLRAVVDIPLMVTGGFRTLKAMNDALESGDTQVVGLGSPLAVEPDLPAKLLTGQTSVAWLDSQRYVDIYLASQLGVDALTSLSPAKLGCYPMMQLIAMGRTREPRLAMTFDESYEQFLIEEDAAYDRLVDFSKSTNH